MRGSPAGELRSIIGSSDYDLMQYKKPAAVFAGAGLTWFEHSERRIFREKGGHACALPLVAIRCRRRTPAAKIALARLLDWRSSTGAQALR